jgi:hypothetical protein
MAASSAGVAGPAAVTIGTLGVAAGSAGLPMGGGVGARGAMPIMVERGRPPPIGDGGFGALGGVGGDLPGTVMPISVERAERFAGGAAGPLTVLGTNDGGLGAGLRAGCPAEAFGPSELNNEAGRF